MLIDFTVENFRSIREPATVSMVEAAPRRSRQKGAARKRIVPTDNEISPALELPGTDLRLMRLAGIFGANGSGKSNIVKAYTAFHHLVTVGPEPRSWVPKIVPFQLDAVSATRPTAFRIRIGIPVGDTTDLFDYGVSLARGQIVGEELQIRRPNERPHFWFRRNSLAGGFEHHGLSRVAVAAAGEVGNDVPLLNFLLRFLRLEPLSGLNQWLSRADSFTDAQVPDWYSRWALRSNPALVGPVTQFLQEADIDILGLEVKRDDDEQRDEVLVKHRTAGEPVIWPLGEESRGTQALFAISAPIVVALRGGGFLALDEFGAHLHPVLTRRIVELFQDPASNPRGAQLLFNAQDVTLLANRLLRRDQVWYTQKHSEGQTELFALSDFKVRNDLAIDLAYLDGRFGAVPLVRLGASNHGA